MMTDKEKKTLATIAVVGGGLFVLYLLSRMGAGVAASPASPAQATQFPGLALPASAGSSYTPGAFTVNNAAGPNPALSPYVPSPGSFDLPEFIAQFGAPGPAPVVTPSDHSHPPLTGGGYPGSSDGGVSPPCGCSTPSDRPYYGSPGIQALALMGNVIAAKRATDPYSNANMTADALSGGNGFSVADQAVMRKRELEAAVYSAAANSNAPASAAYGVTQGFDSFVSQTLTGNAPVRPPLVG